MTSTDQPTEADTTVVSTAVTGSPERRHGPLVGIDGGDGPVTTYLATGIVRASVSALDSSKRLKAKSWIDVAIDSTAGAKTVEAAFLNVTATAPTSAGCLKLSRPGARPASSSVDVTTGATVPNAAFVGLGFCGSAFVVMQHGAPPRR